MYSTFSLSITCSVYVFVGFSSVLYTTSQNCCHFSTWHQLFIYLGVDHLGINISVSYEQHTIVRIIKIKIVLYTQLSQLSHISLELSKHNIITMCCHTMYLEKKCFSHYFKKKCTLGKTPLLPLGHAHNCMLFIGNRYVYTKMINA
jgi:hypothetical protein